MCKEIFLLVFKDLPFHCVPVFIVPLEKQTIIIGKLISFFMSIFSPWHSWEGSAICSKEQFLMENSIFQSDWSKSRISSINIEPVQPFMGRPVTHGKRAQKYGERMNESILSLEQEAALNQEVSICGRGAVLIRDDSLIGSRLQIVHSLLRTVKDRMII